MKQPRDRFHAALIAFALGAVLCAGVPASADLPNPPDFDFYSGACVELADTLDPSVWMPVGCELGDCCPRCPGNVIDWRVQVAGNVIEKVVLKFENLPPQVIRGLTIKGNARWEGSSLHVGRGESVISGFKHDPRAVPPVATPRLIANKDALRKLKEAADREDATAFARQARPDVNRELGRMEVLVEQMMGQYVVDEARVGYGMTRCPNFIGQADHITVNNNISEDNLIVLLDGRGANGCVRDQSYRGKGTVFVGDLRNNADCNSEFSVFSKDNAMAFVTPVFWSDSIFDDQPVTLGPLLTAPVVVWLVIDESGSQERIEWDLATANSLFNSNYAGIAFKPFIRDVHLVDGAREKIGASCSKVSEIKNSPYYWPNQLNVYYIDKWIYAAGEDPWKGKTCWLDNTNSANHEPNIMFINRWAPADTLTHEFGHAFSLDEVTNLPGWAGNHIMWQGVTNRTDFTIGQSFRMNVNVTSKLNVNGVRTGRTRDPMCLDGETSDLCPWLRLDVTPK